MGFHPHHLLGWMTGIIKLLQSGLHQHHFPEWELMMKMIQKVIYRFHQHQSKDELVRQLGRIKPIALGLQKLRNLSPIEAYAEADPGQKPLRCQKKTSHQNQSVTGTSLIIIRGILFLRAASLRSCFALPPGLKLSVLQFQCGLLPDWLHRLLCPVTRLKGPATSDHVPCSGNVWVWTSFSPFGTFGFRFAWKR